MDRLDDEDIGIIWARHYPRRAEHDSSMSLCVTLSMIIKQRAKSADQYDPAKLDQALASAHVPSNSLRQWKMSQPLSAHSRHCFIHIANVSSSIVNSCNLDRDPSAYSLKRASFSSSLFRFPASRS
jgi:hypothetical protein